MKQVNMLDAKTHLSRLIADIESHREDEVIVARNGRPVARLVAFETPPDGAADRRIGSARGVLTIPDDIDTPFGDLSGVFEGNGT